MHGKSWDFNSGENASEWGTMEKDLGFGNSHGIMANKRWEIETYQPKKK